MYGPTKSSSPTPTNALLRTLRIIGGPAHGQVVTVPSTQTAHDHRTDIPQTAYDIKMRRPAALVVHPLPAPSHHGQG
jgi:hypothetical protein